MTKYFKGDCILNYSDLIKKRAQGYYASEEVIEYERGRKNKFLFCKKRNRLYFADGFLKIVNPTIQVRGIKFDIKKYRCCSADSNLKRGVSATLLLHVKVK